MSKLECSCGSLIIDQSDRLPHKAEVFTDAEHERLWEGAARAIGTIVNAEGGIDLAGAERFFGHPLAAGASVEDIAYHVLARVSGRLRRELLECAECGRLWLQAAPGKNAYLGYSPDEPSPDLVLRGS